ncbi:MAG: carboxymethylenebutenolidase [Frankiales bacterium]|nr:carboxymethylenebutenolidase [Frankiales bacterium]
MTPSPDLDRRRLDVPTPDGTADAYLVRPAGDAPVPGVLLFMDAIGLRPTVEQMADRLAAAGCAVLAPNLFYRGGRAPVVPDVVGRLQSEDRAAVFGELRPFMAALTPEVAARDTTAYVQALVDAGGADPSRLATTGYCMGGALALRAAAQLPDQVRAAASFHGGNLAPEDGTGPERLAGQVRAEVYAGHADEDPSMPPEQVARFEQAFREAGVAVTSEVYAGASHGFTMRDMPVHDAAAEQRHWDALLGLLGRTVLAGG